MTVFRLFLLFLFWPGNGTGFVFKSVVSFKGGSGTKPSWPRVREKGKVHIGLWTYTEVSSNPSIKRKTTRPFHRSSVLFQVPLTLLFPTFVVPFDCKVSERYHVLPLTGKTKRSLSADLHSSRSSRHSAGNSLLLPRTVIPLGVLWVQVISLQGSVVVQETDLPYTPLPVSCDSKEVVGSVLFGSNSTTGLCPTTDESVIVPLC